MDIYKYGKIVSIGKTYLILETNNMGTIIYVPNIRSFKINEWRKIFIYKYNTEFTSAIYGFSTFNERVIFEDLISINGVGPKIALSLLKDGKDNIINLICNMSTEKLSSFPYIGSKTANQIVFELSSKYNKMFKRNKEQKLVFPIEAKKTLKILGFNAKQINYAINKISPENNIEKLIEEAIKAISNAKFT
ncbi:MAG: Holliday junction branch migration protein RuvA [Mycoplasmatales bacterium]|nr:Holliday junction branch migration protein RuvA [Mycoplasmatales bacterium]